MARIHYKKPVFPCKPFFQLLSWGSRTRVFIGFNFKPMLSGERSSGAMQDGLKGLLGLTLDWEGLYKPYPMRKYSIGINIAWGCSSVTIDPHAWTCRSHTPPVMSLLYIYGKIQLMHDMIIGIWYGFHTSTKALYRLSSFEVMYRASEWNGELSPTNISERHCSFRNPSEMSGLLLGIKNRVNSMPPNASNSNLFKPI